jgi:glyoxalase family protein
MTHYLSARRFGKDTLMLDQINGLHHVTSMAAGARENNAFFTDTLGLRRIKKTVNFDAPDVYHLYYGAGAGTPGTVMTYFPFPDIGQRRRGTGEVGLTRFAVPRDALPFWAERLAHAGVEGLRSAEVFGEARLDFLGPDGDEFALVAIDDDRTPWTGGGVPDDAAIRGFHGVTLRLAEAGPTDELLRFMGFAVADRDGALTRYRRAGGNGADAIEIEALPDAPRAVAGAGSVHHVAFAVADRDAQTAVRRALANTGYQVTPPIDRDYFWAIYFRTPGGVLFEVATNEPGFARDEDPAHLGEGLMLPSQHAHRRAELERRLEPIE